MRKFLHCCLLLYYSLSLSAHVNEGQVNGILIVADGNMHFQLSTSAQVLAGILPEDLFDDEGYISESSCKRITAEVSEWAPKMLRLQLQQEELALFIAEVKLKLPEAEDDPFAQPNDEQSYLPSEVDILLRLNVALPANASEITGQWLGFDLEAAQYGGNVSQAVVISVIGDVTDRLKLTPEAPSFSLALIPLPQQTLQMLRQSRLLPASPWPQRRLALSALAIFVLSWIFFSTKTPRILAATVLLAGGLQLQHSPLAQVESYWKLPQVDKMKQVLLEAQLSQLYASLNSASSERLWRGIVPLASRQCREQLFAQMKPIMQADLLTKRYIDGLELTKVTAINDSALACEWSVHGQVRHKGHLHERLMHFSGELHFQADAEGKALLHEIKFLRDFERNTDDKN